MTKTQALTPSQLRELRSEMERELAWLLRSLTKKRTSDARSSTDASSDNARSEHAEMERVLRDRAQSRLTAIVDGLSRMDDGHCGVCVSCGARIPYGRLIAMPETTHCIACSGQGGRLNYHEPALGFSQSGGVT